MFSQVSVCPQGGRAWRGGGHGEGCVCGRGVCMAGGGACILGGGHVWQGGMHGGGMCDRGGMHGRRHTWQVGGMHNRGHAWQGGMHGRGCMAGGHVWQGACMAGGCGRGSDTVNERPVRILLECILVYGKISHNMDINHVILPYMARAGANVHGVSQTVTPGLLNINVLS